MVNRNAARVLQYAVLYLSRRLVSLGARGFHTLRNGQGRVRDLLLRSLFAKITATIVAGIVVTSAAVGLYAIRTTGSFLHKKVNQSFPLILDQVKDKVYLWYDQRFLDMKTFANSDVILRYVTVLKDDRLGPKERAGVQSELTRYLSYVNEGDSYLLDLTLVDAGGRIVVSTNPELELTGHLKAMGRSTSSLYISAVEIREGGEPHQILGHVVGEEKQRLGFLVARLNLDSVRPLLRPNSLGPSGRLYLAGSNGRVFLGSSPPGDASLPEQVSPRAQPGDHPTVYRSEDDRKVLGASLYLPRFGWSLVYEEDYRDVFEPILLIRKKLLLVNSVIILVFSFFAFRIVRSITRPILALSQGAKKLIDGMVAVEVRSESSSDEVAFLIRTFNELTQEIAVSRTKMEAINRKLELKNEELKTLNARLEHLSVTDELTGLYNYRQFQNLLAEDIKRVERTAYPLSLVLMDLDNFKKVNDRYGHKTGDAYLCYLSNVLRGIVRETDVLARYGGEEFAILLPHTDLRGAEKIAEKVRKTVESSWYTVDGDEKIRGTVSMGVAEFRGDPLRFFEDADKGLYQSKRKGKNRVTVTVTGEDGEEVEARSDGSKGRGEPRA
jgi:diguanylate cyclase (GGDEF)-like protein